MIFSQPLPHASTPTVDRNAPRSRQLPVDPTQPLRVLRQLQRLADCIETQFPATTGGTLMFSGVGSRLHIACVAEHVARRLAEQRETEVVLVDGDTETRLLSERLAAGDNPGLAEVLQCRTTVASALIDTDAPKVRLLPFGDRRNARNPIASDTVESMLADLRRTFRYTVIVSGRVTSPLPALLSRFSDGTYLVVQLGAASRQDAVGLASQLTHAGGRLLGCVATGVA